MKKLINTICLCLLTLVTFAQQSNLGINYQAVARNSDNEVVSNQEIGIELQIIANGVNGDVLYTETHEVLSDANGLINLVIGTGVSANDFAAIDWSTGVTFLQTSMDLTGGVDYQSYGTVQFASIPYALFAESVRNADDADANPTNEIQSLSDVLVVDNNASNLQLKNLANPTDDQDAATKAYVDALLARVEALEALNEDTPDDTDTDPDLSGAVNVTLVNAGGAKLAVVKLVKELTGLGLKESKELVDNAPSLLFEEIDYETAVFYKQRLEEAGAEVLIEFLQPASFDVVLKNAGSSKLAVVKLVKELTGLGLKESKELVDRAPSVIFEDVDSELATSYKSTFEEAGAEIELK